MIRLGYKDAKSRPVTGLSVTIKAPIGSGYNRKPNRTEAKFGSVPVRFREPKISVRFGSDPKNINRTILLSRDRRETKFSSLDSSHRDESNGGRFVSLGAIDDEIFRL